MFTPSTHRITRRATAALAALALAACGGSSEPEDGYVAPPASCSVAAQQDWLGDYMDQWYFWYRQSPRPNPAAFATVGGYFDALLYTGVLPDFPADRWSRSEPTESFNRFFGDGATLGYGVAVNGIEAVDVPGTPLVVRYVEPRSDAAAQGVRRGDQVISINGRSAADIVAADDFSALTADRSGDTLRLVLRRSGVDRTVTLLATVFDLTPVSGTDVFISAGGRRLGYLMVKDMIRQAETGVASAFASFRTRGIDEVVVDLRYNGGGLVSTGANVASYIAGGRGSGRVYARLLYNDRRAAAWNEDWRFGNPRDAAGVSRVFVLTGPRTASASEQFVNGLRGIGVSVVTVGDTTFGKPVGSLPTSACGTTYSAVNFESVNERNEGRYFDGFAASCPVAEDYAVAIGDGADPLLATAAFYADTGRCAPVGATREPFGVRGKARRTPRLDERSVLLPR